MKYAVKMGSGATIYKPSSIKIDLGIQKLRGEGWSTDTQTAWWSDKPILFSKYGKMVKNDY
jgi:hypothetical protein